MAIILQQRYLFVVLCWSLLFVKFSFAQEDIISFYPKAYAKTQNPPEEKKLMVIAEQKMEDKYVTFLGVEKGKVLLAAITNEQLKKVKDKIRLKVRFEEKYFGVELGYYASTFFEMRRVSLDTNYMSNWGYVFDRNNDGKIDYIAYFVGIYPVKRKDFPSDFPKDLKSLGRSEQQEYVETFKKSCQLIFVQSADDNFDGEADAVVIERMDTERDWVDSWMILEDVDLDEKIDSCWFFRDSVGVKIRGCLKTKEGFWTYRAGGKSSVFGNEDLSKISENFSLLNKAANLCGLTKDSFYKE